MARIKAPNPQYSGVSASVAFSGGVGFTDIPYLLDWFAAHGYAVEDGDAPAVGAAAVEDGDAPLEGMTVEELRACAGARGIALPNGKKAELLAALRGAQ